MDVPRYCSTAIGAINNLLGTTILKNLSVQHTLVTFFQMAAIISASDASAASAANAANATNAANAATAASAARAAMIQSNNLSNTSHRSIRGRVMFSKKVDANKILSEPTEIHFRRSRITSEIRDRDMSRSSVSGFGNSFRVHALSCHKKVLRKAARNVSFNNFSHPMIVSLLRKANL